MHMPTYVLVCASLLVKENTEERTDPRTDGGKGLSEIGLAFKKI